MTVKTTCAMHTADNNLHAASRSTSQCDDKDWFEGLQVQQTLLAACLHQALCIAQTCTSQTYSIGKEAQVSHNS